jgi:putative ABC transport system permease protein
MKQLVARWAGSVIHPEAAAVLLLTAVSAGPGAYTAVLAYRGVAQPLPFHDAHRLVDISEQNSTGDGVSPASCSRWIADKKALSDVGCYYKGGGTILAAGGASEWVQTASVSRGLLAALQIRPLAGRSFGPAEESRVVLISEALWRGLFGGSSTAIGSALSLGGRPYTVIGVFPNLETIFPGVGVLDLQSFDRPIGRRERGTRYFGAIGRLAPAATLASARANLERVQSTLAADYPDTHRDWKVRVMPLKQALTANYRTTLLVTSALGAGLMLAAGLNLALTVLAATSARQLGNTIRAVLGATPARLFWQELWRNVPAAGTGILVGSVLTVGLDRTFTTALAVEGVPVPELSWLIAIGSALAVPGLAIPAAVAARGSTASDLSPMLRGSASPGSLAGMRWIALGEIAGTVIVTALLVALLGDFRALSQTPSGLDARGVQMADVRWPLFDNDRLAVASRLEEAMARFGSVGLSSTSIDELPPAAFFALDHEDRRFAARYASVSSGYFRAVGLRLVVGRPLGPDDRESSRLVAVVSLALCRRTGVEPSALSMRRSSASPETRSTPRNRPGLSRLSICRWRNSPHRASPSSSRNGSKAT